MIPGALGVLRNAVIYAIPAESSPLSRSGKPIMPLHVSRQTQPLAGLGFETPTLGV